VQVIDMPRILCYNPSRLKGVVIMAGTTNLSIRLDRELKDQADRIFSAMGMSLTTAITVFVRQAVRQKKIPFEISLMDSESRVAAMRDALAASERIWQNSVQSGTDQMIPDEIDAEIAAARTERRARKGDA
jgi:DNA-damage-inducible protein J